MKQIAISGQEGHFKAYTGAVLNPKKKILMKIFFKPNKVACGLGTEAFPYAQCYTDSYSNYQKRFKD